MSVNKFSEKLDIYSKSGINRNATWRFKEYVNLDNPLYSKPLYTKYPEDLLDDYYYRIYSTSTKVNVNLKDKEMIRKRPEMASFIYLGDFGFSNLILKLNDCTSWVDFDNFEFLIIPSAQEIENIIQEIKNGEANNKRLK